MEIAGQRRGGRQRIFFWLLTAALILFSAWSLMILLQVQGLRSEFARGLRWVESLQRTRTAVEGSRTGEAEPSTGSGSELRDLRRLMAGDPAFLQNPQLLLAWRDLEPALEGWHGAVGEGGDADRLWETSGIALESLNRLESALQGRLNELHERLGRSWTSLLALVFASLLLAASNLLLLRLAFRRGRALESAHLDAVERSSHDALTGLWNRGAILRQLGQELVRARRSGVPLGLILTDLDRFAEINGLVGREQGDDILRQIAVRLSSMVRPYDTLGRFEGDSFLLFLPSCDESGTEAVAERLLAVVNKQDVEYAHGHLLVPMSLAYLTVEDAEDADLDLLLGHLRDGIAAARRQGDGRMYKVSVSSPSSSSPSLSDPSCSGPHSIPSSSTSKTSIP